MVENKQVNQPLRPVAAIKAPVVHGPSGLVLPANIRGWMRSAVTAEQARQPILKVGYNSGKRLLDSAEYTLEQNATVSIFPAGGKTVEEVLELQVKKVLAKHPEGERKPLKSAIGMSEVVTYFDPKRGWHWGREACVVKHNEHIMIYQAEGPQGIYKSGYSQVEELTGVIHGLKK